MVKYVVVDLDGTVADCTHRLHFINGETKDWKGFYEACKDDKPIASMIDMVRALNERYYYVIFLTGRSELARNVTQEWLQANNLWNYDDLIMRPLEDYRQDSVVKLEMLNNYIRTNLNNDKEAIGFILEDRATVVKSFRDAGFKVLQVAEGDF